MQYRAVVFKDAQARSECASMGLAAGQLPASITLPRHFSMLIYSPVLWLRGENRDNWTFIAHWDVTKNAVKQHL